MCLDLSFLYRHQDGVLAKKTFYGSVRVFVVSL